MIAAWQTRGTFEDGLNLFIHLYLWGFFLFSICVCVSCRYDQNYFFLSFRPFF